MWVLGICVIGALAAMLLEYKLQYDERIMGLNVWFSSAFGITGVFSLLWDSWARTVDMPYLYASPEADGTQFRLMFFGFAILFLLTVGACLIGGYKNVRRSTHLGESRAFWLRLIPVPFIVALMIQQIYVISVAVKQVAEM